MNEEPTRELLHKILKKSEVLSAIRVAAVPCTGEHVMPIMTGLDTFAKLHVEVPSERWIHTAPMTAMDLLVLKDGVVRKFADSLAGQLRMLVEAQSERPFNTLVAVYPKHIVMVVADKKIQVKLVQNSSAGWFQFGLNIPYAVVVEPILEGEPSKEK